MNKFKILSTQSWYTNPSTNTRHLAVFVEQDIDAYYHAEYQGGNRERRETIGTVENIITTLKNQFKDKSNEVLVSAGKSLVQILEADFAQILRETGKKNLTVCVIPRAKAEISYTSNQLVFKQAVKVAVNKLDGFSDGTNYIVRHVNTKTTHLVKSGYSGDGDLPYPGITKKTCIISNNVKGNDILLVDDLYTETINIDEDAIQALLDIGANSVLFYSLGKTMPRT